MQNNKGFTLVELLVIIIILAIIAFITVPQVQGFTENARKGAAKSSVLYYVEAFEKTTVAGLADTADYTGLENGYYPLSKLATMNIQTKGKVPTSGWILVQSSEAVAFSLVIDDKYVVTSEDVNKEPKVEEGKEAQAIPEGATIIE